MREIYPDLKLENGIKIYLKDKGKYLSREGNTWTAHKLSTEIALKFVKNNILAINQTWIFDSNLILDEVKGWLDKDSNNIVIFLSLFDPPNFKLDTDLLNSSRIRYINSGDICFWLIAVDQFFIQYSIDQVTPTNFTNNFLCYQRKTWDRRETLYNTLINKKGIITLGNKEYNEINSNLPKHNGYIEIGNRKDQLYAPNDIWSLGNIDIWNTSFLNIVSETRQNVHSPVPFVSEKIFKPIIGLRPFVCYGNPNTTNLLKSLGFETFDEEFGYKPTTYHKNDAEQLASIVDNLDNIDKIDMFNKLLPKLIYNKNHLKNAALNEWKKIDILAENIK